MLKTPRLLLKEITINELQLVHDLHSLPETDEFNTMGIPENIQVTEAIMHGWIEAMGKLPRTSYVFGIYTVESGSFIGLIAINIGKASYKNAEVWYKIHKDFWGNGFATEALKTLLEFGFGELKLHRIEAGCAVENAGSVRVLEKSGMTLEGRKRKNLPIRGEWKDNFFYAILEEDFQKY